jgi:hypothetical protein
VLLLKEKWRRDDVEKISQLCGDKRPKTSRSTKHHKAAQPKSKGRETVGGGFVVSGYVLYLLTVASYSILGLLPSALI